MTMFAVFRWTLALVAPFLILGIGLPWTVALYALYIATVYVAWFWPVKCLAKIAENRTACWHTTPKGFWLTQKAGYNLSSSLFVSLWLFYVHILARLWLGFGLEKELLMFAGVPVPDLRDWGHAIPVAHMLALWAIACITSWATALALVAWAFAESAIAMRRQRAGKENGMSRNKLHRKLTVFILVLSLMVFYWACSFIGLSGQITLEARMFVGLGAGLIAAVAAGYITYLDNKRRYLDRSSE